MRTDSHSKNRLLNFLLRFVALRYSDGVYIARHSVLGAKIEIGTGSRINGPVFVRGTGKLTIGNYCAFGHEIRFITSNHSTGVVAMQHQLQRQLGVQVLHAGKKNIRVGNGAWVGDRAMIMAGVEIGNGAVIGAGSVVTKDVAPYSICAGNPARQVGDRFEPNLRDALDATAWWNWDAKQLRRAKKLFEVDLTGMEAIAAINFIKETVTLVNDEAT